MKYLLLALAVLLLRGTVAQGQDAAAPAAKQWYVGVGAAAHSYFSINRPYSRLRPAHITGGYYIKPRVALQIELQYGREIGEEQFQSVVDGENVTFLNKTETRSTSVTLLSRFSRSQPQRHLQFDWLLGLAMVYGREQDTTSRTSASGTDTHVYQPILATAPHVVGGISLRYLAGAHVAFNAELLANKNLEIPPISIWGMIPGGGASLGVSYAFQPRQAIE
jgi:opacity protein-like surface antigen